MYAEAIKRFKESTHSANEKLSDLKGKKENLKELNKKIGEQIDERTKSLTETKEEIDKANDEAQKAIDSAREKDTDNKYSNEIKKSQKANDENKEKAQVVEEDIEQSKQEKVSYHRSPDSFQ